jgi:SNF2 family DNA or RNA helicase
MEDPMFCGGLLADEMGLGKTSMTSTFLFTFFLLAGDKFYAISD